MGDSHLNKKQKTKNKKTKIYSFFLIAMSIVSIVVYARANFKKGCDGKTKPQDDIQLIELL